MSALFVFTGKFTLIFFRKAASIVLVVLHINYFFYRSKVMRIICNFNNFTIISIF